MRRLLAALTLLTVIPVPRFNPTEEDLAGCKPCFPLVGLLVGAAAAGMAWLLIRIFPQPVAAVAMVIFLALVSKGFHLDGLADSADGLLSSRTRERMLEIMRDSHIGSMGVLAIVAVLGLKAAAFLSLPTEAIPPVAAFTALSGRCAIVIYISLSRYARENGLGAVMFSNRSMLVCFWTVAVWYGAAWWFLGSHGIIIALGLTLLPFIWAEYTARKLGGATGDTIGACEELIEMSAPLLFLIYMRLMVNTY